MTDRIELKKNVSLNHPVKHCNKSHSFTFVEAAETEAEVEADDSELADSDSGDPGRLIFLRLRGRPFNLGAVNLIFQMQIIAS